MRQVDLFDRDLSPYTNDDFLIRRISGPNRLLRNAPELQPQIRSALLAEDDESLVELAEDLNLARQLYSPEKEKPINRILSFLNLLESINDIRASLPPETAPHIEPRLNVLFELSYRNIANSFPEEMLDDAQLTTNYLVHRSQLLYEQFLDRDQAHKEKSGGTKALENLRIRLGGLHEAIRSCNDACKYMNGLSDDTGETIDMYEAEADSRYITQLFREMRASQRYGVKMGYIGEDHLGGALIFSPVMSALDFTETEQLRSIYHPLLDKTDAVAQIIHTQRKHHRRLKVTKSETLGYSSGGVEDLGPAAAFTIGPDGELYTWRDCKISLRDIALRKGKYQAYRELQATVLAHYYDLTHPLDEVARVQKALRERPPLTNPGTRPALESIERLFVPRVRHYTPDTLPDESQPSSTPEDGPIRELRRHDVTWHVRKLPAGWNPSPAALELAEKLGAVLEPGETVVRDHKRGNLALGQVTAHHLIKRPNS